MKNYMHAIPIISKRDKELTPENYTVIVINTTPRLEFH